MPAGPPGLRAPRSGLGSLHPTVHFATVLISLPVLGTSSPRTPPPAPPHLSPAALQHRFLRASAQLTHPTCPWGPHRATSFQGSAHSTGPGEPSGQHLSGFPKAPATSCPLLPLPPAPRALWLLLRSQGNILSQDPECPRAPSFAQLFPQPGPSLLHSAWQRPLHLRLPGDPWGLASAPTPCVLILSGRAWHRLGACQ